MKGLVIKGSSLRKVAKQRLKLKVYCAIIKLVLTIYHFNSIPIVKQVLTTYLNHSSRVHFLEPTSTGIIIMRNHSCDSCGVSNPRSRSYEADTLSIRPTLSLPFELTSYLSPFIILINKLYNRTENVEEEEVYYQKNYKTHFQYSPGVI